MASDLPAPLSPPDCDLRGYDYMPLFGHRLFNSAFNDTASDAEFRAALRLWWAAWQQCPAGSLPDDDGALARLADFGRDLKAWRKVRVAALHGFVQCSDGRFYHPMLCQQAQDAFERRRKERDRKAKMRESKRTPDGTGGGTKVEGPRPVPRDTPRTENGTNCGTNAGQAQDVPVERRGEERREESKQRSTPPSRATDTSTHATPIMPTLADPPSAWMHLADKRETDDDGVERPVVGGFYLDGIAADVCNAARIDGRTRAVDWRPLVALLRDGYSPHFQIIPTIQRLASRVGYQPPRFLTYFDQAIREARAA